MFELSFQTCAMSEIMQENCLYHVKGIHAISIGLFLLFDRKVGKAKRERREKGKRERRARE